jgi:hypothetical protein
LTLTGIGVAGISGVTEVVAARRSRMALASFHGHDSHGTHWKALILDGRKRRLRRAKEQEGTREKDKKGPHHLFLSTID